jgi:molecular chaperone DnaK
MKIRKTVGIDLGTTNSVIALLDPTDSVLLTGQDEQGRKTFPSLVGYHPEEQRPVVGRPAARLRGQPAGPVASVKRFMGLDREFPVGPERLTPPHVSARILRLLRDVLARTLNEGRYVLDSAIITMPAYFNHNQIEATRQAGELAGYEVVELLHEPTAAAIYYGWLLGHGDAHYLVYDLGGGTFDVSVIRKRYGDYEVLSVSGDPFLGGDDFDRLLASHLIATAHFKASGSGAALDAGALPLQPGTLNFARLVQVAEGVKIDLSAKERVVRYMPELLEDEEGAKVGLEGEVDRAAFNRLIKGKVDRTIDCCHEALRRAKDKAGLRLGDIDYVVLVGGSSKIPQVRDTVRAAFCNPNLPEHARSTEPLVHEPDLCVAYGAALRAATYGVRYCVALDKTPRAQAAVEQASSLARRGASEDACSTAAGGLAEGGAELELHVTSPAGTTDNPYVLVGLVRGPAAAAVSDGGSVRVRSLATGLVEEAFLDNRGAFEQSVELQPNTDNILHLTVCDPAGRELARVEHRVRHQDEARPLGQGVLPTQLITKPLKIQVLNRACRRVKQVIAPVGASLPGVFACTCRTVDQSGRIVVPVFEENRLVKQLVIDQVDPGLPLGSPVEVEFRIDVKHNIQVRVKIRGQAAGEQVVTAYIESPPPPGRPTREEIEQVSQEIEELLGELGGSFRTRMAAEARRLVQDLNEALEYEDEPRAIQRLAELGDLLQELQVRRSQVLDPPWPRFAQRVKQCLHQAAAVADRTGRSRQELFEQVYAQERYAERAYEDKNQPLYQECFENLGQLAGYLDRLLSGTLPQSHRSKPAASPEEDAREEVERFHGYLEAVTERVREKGRRDLEERLTRLAEQGRTLAERARTDPLSVVREARRLITEIAKVEEELAGTRRKANVGESGLLGQ